MGIGQHKADEAPEVHPDTLVCYALALAVVIVIELGGILAVLLERFK
jgi:hypothetical protein